MYRESYSGLFLGASLTFQMSMFTADKLAKLLTIDQTIDSVFNNICCAMPLKTRETNMCTHLTFKYETATQALNYLAVKSGGTINKMKALKLIFFSDRYHLRKYGRPVTNDEYLAMSYGPVASGVKDIAEMSVFLDSKVEEYAKKSIQPEPRYNYRSLSAVDTDVFSESEIEALNYAWDHFGCMSEFILADLTHQYPEWKRHEAALKSVSNVRMDYLDFLEDPPNGRDPCCNLTADDKEIISEMVQETSKIAKLMLG
jgi:uncharacterized phage-associated protein